MIDDLLDEFSEDDTLFSPADNPQEQVVYPFPFSEKNRTIIFEHFEDFYGQRAEIMKPIWKPSKLKYKDKRSPFRYGISRKSIRKNLLKLPFVNKSLEVIIVIYYAVEHCLELTRKSEPNGVPKRLHRCLNEVSIGNGLIGRTSYISLMARLSFINQIAEYCNGQAMPSISKHLIFAHMKQHYPQYDLDPVYIGDQGKIPLASGLLTLACFSIDDCVNLARNSQVASMEELQKMLDGKSVYKGFISRGQFLKSLSDLGYLTTVSDYCLDQTKVALE